ncbi:MAG: electron transport complex subunit E [Treponema sp.]|nr:electron transport complex subunit E [Treponema sp.]
MNTPKRLASIFSNGLIRENPLGVLMIGLCPSLAVTTSVENGIGMGLSTTFVLLMSEVVISLLKKLIPDSIRMPIFITVVATFTTVIDYSLKAWFPDLSKALGLFIQLIVVNCIIMGRVEGFASKHPISDVIPDALGMGLGFTWVLTAIAAVRELLGNGTLLGFQALPSSYPPILFFVLAPGGFFIFSLFIAFNLFVKSRLKDPPKAADCEQCPGSGCMKTHCGIPEDNGGPQE